MIDSTSFWFKFLNWFEVEGIPSITIKGSVLPLIEEAPRIKPSNLADPGEPELEIIVKPGAVPCKEPNTEALGLFSIISDEIVV